MESSCRVWKGQFYHAKIKNIFFSLRQTDKTYPNYRKSFIIKSVLIRDYYYCTPGKYHQIRLTGTWLLGLYHKFFLNKISGGVLWILWGKLKEIWIKYSLVLLSSFHFYSFISKKYEQILYIITWMTIYICLEVIVFV